MSSVWMLLWLVAAMSCVQGMLACYANFRTPGSTEPLGDIILPMGSELVINCTLNANYKRTNSSSLYWVISKKEVPSRFVTILNERTAQLRIRNASEEYCGNLSCRLRPSITVCMNAVKLIGPLPARDELNFSCTSYEWDSLKCTWNLPPSCRLNTMIWKLYYLKVGGRVYCSKNETYNENSYGCVFDGTTNPVYDAFMRTFFFVLTVQNDLDKKEYSFEVDHYSRVIPSAPMFLRTTSYTSTKLKLEWDISDEFKIFPALLVYQLRYRSEWDQPGNFTEILLTNETSLELESLIPHANYFVWLRYRIQTATDEAMWSPIVSETFQTSSAVPICHVNTTSSNFIEIRDGMDMRNVTLFWEPIPRPQQFGAKFHYIIREYSDDGRNATHTAPGGNFSYGLHGLHSDKSYWFKIQAANEVGDSPHTESIFINKSSPKRPEAEDLTIIDLKNGRYNVSWRPPKSHPLVTGYLVVWCKGMGSSPRFQPCSAPLSWISAAANETTRIITVDDASEISIYRFGVAVNSIYGSSGLATWSHCIADYDGIPGKMKMKRLRVEGATSIGVSWELDCSQQLGVITGFLIQYCVSDPKKQKCIGGQEELKVEGARERSFSIPNLKPHASYRVTVAAMAKSIGEACDPEFAKTKQAAPSDAPSNLISPAVTNTSISVQWELPLQPNGVLTYHLVYYDKNNGFPHRPENISFEHGKQTTSLGKNIESYTNYTITVEACTSEGCSPPSLPLSVLTEVGVPGQPEIPKARVDNNRILVGWDEPAHPNGPIQEWNLYIMKQAKDETTNSTENVTSKSFVLPTVCGQGNSVSYSFAVQAVTETKSGEKLMGPWSELVTLSVCPTAYLFGSIGETIGAFIGIILVLIGILYGCITILLPKYRKFSRPLVILPEGLLTEGSERKYCIPGYNDFEKNVNQNRNNSVDGSVPAKLLNRLQSISSDEGRGSQNSTETTLHETSSFTSLNDENMYTDQTSLDRFRNKHNLSSESSGCSSGGGSVSSALTARIHLSSDSGNEADFPTPVASPDSVFCDLSSYPPGITSALNYQLRLRNPQRPGEDDLDATLVNSDRLTMERPEEDPVQISANHYCKAAVNTSGSNPSLMKSVHMDSEPMVESSGTSALPLTMYSQVGLCDPLQSSSGYQKSEIGNWDPDPKTPKSVSSVDSSQKAGRQEDQKKTNSYVALSILSDPIQVQKQAPAKELVKGQSHEMIPYSCVGIVPKLEPVTSTLDDQANKNDSPSTSNNPVHKTELQDAPAQYSGPTDATHVPSAALKGGPRLMSDLKDGLKISDANQTKPKRPSYIALTRMQNPDLEGSQMGQSGYSKVGQLDMTTRCLPEGEARGSLLPTNKVNNVTEENYPIVPAARGYVTLGLKDLASLKRTPFLDNAEPGPSQSKLSFDPILAGDPSWDRDDMSSTWESELEISEESLTEEDFHSVEQTPSAMRGYVCVGRTHTEAGKDVI